MPENPEPVTWQDLNDAVLQIVREGLKLKEMIDSKREKEESNGKSNP